MKRETTEPANLKEISALAEAQLKAQSEVERVEGELKLAKESLRKIAEEDLPEAMREAGMLSFTLGNGFKVDVKDNVRASITEANKPAAHAWLREHGYEALIKSEVAVIFPRTESGAMPDVLEELRKRFGEDRVDAKESVHPQTLLAWLRERMAEAGDAEKRVEIPFDLFSANFFSAAKITPPKAQKQRA